MFAFFSFLMVAFQSSNSFKHLVLRSVSTSHTLYCVTSSPRSFRQVANDKLNSMLKTGLTILGSQILPFTGRAVTTLNGPIVVIGSNGKTGKLIVDQLASENIAVRPAYRDISKVPAPVNSHVEPPVAADVTKIETIGPAIAGASAVIFAASASNKGGSAAQVDYQGVINVATECVRLKIPKLVVISSGAITRPDSLGFKITNLFGGIMDYKLRGENALRELYSKANLDSLSYVIIRPGGLTDGPAAGPSKIELNQGDTISGELSRADVAECAEAAALSAIIPKNVVFEMYQADRKAPLQSNFSPNSGYERRGSDYDTMFAGLKTGPINI